MFGLVCPKRVSVRLLASEPMSPRTTRISADRCASALWKYRVSHLLCTVTIDPRSPLSCVVYLGICDIVLLVKVALLCGCDNHQST